MNRPPANRRSRFARFVLAAVTCVLLASPALAAPGARSIDGVWSELAPNAVQSGSLIYDFDSPPQPSPVRKNFLDLYVPPGAGGEGRPVVVYVHGGGWRNAHRGPRGL